MGLTVTTSQAPPRWTQGYKTPQTMGDPGAMNPNTHYTRTPSHTLTHTHTQCYFMVPTGGTVRATLSSQWSICAHLQAVAVLQVQHYATASEAHGDWCTVRDMMHKVMTKPLDHWTRSASVQASEVC